MEYRRRRKRRTGMSTGYSGYTRRSGYRSSRGSNADAYGLGSALLILLLTAGLIYILFATSVGTWIAKNVFSPLFSKGDTEPSTSLPTAELPTANLIPSETPYFTDKSTESMTLSGLDMYALQMGVYSSIEYAQGMISTLKSLGAAGYEFFDGQNIRVFASAYNTEAAAKSVSARLNDQGYECTIYNLRADAVELTVTADAEKMESIRTAINFAHSLIDDINEEVIGFDSEERSIDYGKAIGNEMLANVKSIRGALSGITEESGLISALDDYYMEVTGAITTFVSADTDNRVEMSGKLKYLQSQIITQYLALMQSIGYNE